MTQWLLEAEVESHLSLAEGPKRVEFVHPAGTYRVILEDKEVAPGVAVPLLTAYVIFDADDIDVAQDVGHEHLREFVETLAVVTGCRARLHRELSLWDWSPAPRTHMGHVLREFPGPGIPVAAIDANIIASVGTLSEKQRDDRVARALRWFAHGVNGGPPDEQFEWFWLAVEVLAQITKDVTPVPDECPRCHEPLYCTTCEETPAHRPYAGQAIRQLIRRYAGDEAERLFEVSEAFRHALTHGERLRVVEQEQGAEVTNVVDRLANVARSALVELLVPTSTERPRVALHVLTPRTFLNYQVEARGIVSFDLEPGRKPQLEDIPGLNIELVHGRIEAPRDDAQAAGSPSA